MNLFICTGNKGKLSEFSHAFPHVNTVGLNSLNQSAKSKFIEPIENSDYFICNALIKLFSAIQFLIVNNLQKNIDRVLVDDSGLCVPQLNFLPGVHSANFAGIPKNDVQNNNLLKTRIENSKDAILFGKEKRLPAFFVCFLMSMSIKEENFKWIKDVNFSEATNLLNQGDNFKNTIIHLEKKFLSKVDLKKQGGSFQERLQANLFYPEFKDFNFIDLSYGFCCGQVSTVEQNNIPGAGHGYDPLFYPLSNPTISFASIPLSEKNNLSHRAFAMSGIQI